jgi:hypothetical protein
MSVQSRGSSNDGFQARGQFQQQSINRSDRGNKFEPRGDYSRGDFSRSDNNKKWSGDDNRRRGDDDKRRGDDDKKWSGKWDRDDKPRLSHKGWSRDHKHKFFGTFLIGVPFGYAAIETHPCYDWVYGPQGWGYYWNYARCPV